MLQSAIQKIIPLGKREFDISYVDIHSFCIRKCLRYAKIYLQYGQLYMSYAYFHVCYVQSYVWHAVFTRNVSWPIYDTARYT